MSFGAFWVVASCQKRNLGGPGQGRGGTFWGPGKFLVERRRHADRGAKGVWGVDVPFHARRGPGEGAMPPPQNFF